MTDGCRNYKKIFENTNPQLNQLWANHILLNKRPLKVPLTPNIFVPWNECAYIFWSISVQFFLIW